MPFIGWLDNANSKPDVKWWQDQINLGERFRKKWCYEDSWSTWRDYYRSDYNNGELPINIFFSMFNSLVPRVYFRNPTISLTPGVPGMEALLFARILQRLDNKLFVHMGVKRQMKRVIRDAFMFGTGFGKIGFGARFTGGMKPYAVNKERVEYGFLQNDLPWFQRVPTDSVIVPWGTDFLDNNTRWCATKYTRSLDDVKADTRFDVSVTKNLVSNEIGREGEMENIPMISLYEIQDRKTNKIFVIASKGNTDKPLYCGDDEMQAVVPFSVMPLVFNENDNAFWGVPDSKILEPYQVELNETNTQIMTHRRVSVAKMLAQKGSIDEAEVEKMVSPDVLPVVWTNEDPHSACLPLQPATIPPELRQRVEDVMMVVRETLGFSRNQAGEFNPGSQDTTATEAQIVNQAVSIRVDERRDMCADLLVEMTTALHEIMYATLPDETVVDMAGPTGAIVWVQFKKDLIRKGRYAVNIDPDSSIPQTVDVRQQKAMQNYQFLAANPYIDPIKLTLYMLTESVPPQFDDLMRNYDPFAAMAQQGMQQSQQAGQTQENPMTMNQYDEMNKTYANGVKDQQLVAPNRG